MPLSLQERAERQKALFNLVEEFSKLSEKLGDDARLEEYAEKFKRIYTGGFRHQYSDLLIIVAECAKTHPSGDLEVFEENLGKLKEYIIAKPELEWEEPREHFLKLWDHLQLEIIHWNLSFGKAHGMLTTVNSRCEELSASLPKLESKVTDAEGRLSKAQTDFVTILGIFAAIVIAFFTGTGYLTSTLGAASSVPLKKLVIIVVIAGLILVDELLVLMSFIAKMTNTKINLSRWGIIFINIGIFFLAGLLGLALHAFEIRDPIQRLLG